MTAPGARLTGRIGRRLWLLLAGAGAVAGCVGVFACGPKRPPLSARGPIVLISIDTLRADRLPAYGYAAGRTPRIDELARDGVVFDRAYTHSPQTLPAHTSILSGLLPQHHGVRDNVGFRVGAGVRLLPTLLREHAYATAGVVSSAVLRDDTGIGAGFDVFDGRMPPARGGAALDEAQRDGNSSLGIALGWIQKQSSPDWFLFLHIYEPHAPYQPPERYRDLAPYDGEIAYADEVVGTLLQELRARDAYDPATIVLLSDHGEGLGEHGEQEHGLFLYEETTRVPLIVKPPRQRRAGSRVSTLVQHIDLVPTLLDLAGIPVPTALPGRSLRPLLEGQTGGWPERDVYSEALFGRYHFGWSELFALTDLRYRFILAPRPELYDLQADPHEGHNLASAKAATAAAMGRALSQMLGRANDTAPVPLAPDVYERLASLGYVGPQARVPSADGSLADPKDKVHVLLRYRTAMTSAAEGRLAEAIGILRQIGREEPGLAEVWLMVGRLLQRLGRGPDAVQAFREYVRRRPSSPAGVLELSSALLALGRLDDAMASAELAAGMAANHESTDRLIAHDMLARIALARGDSAAARRYADAAGTIDPGFPLRDYVEGRLAYAAQQFGEASFFFERAVLASRSRMVQIRGLHLYAGDTLAHLERFAEAEKEFREEIRLFPESTWAYLSLANLYQTFGRIEDADQVIEAMLRTVPSAEARAQASQLRARRTAAGERP